MKFDQLWWAPEKHPYSLYAQCLGTWQAKIFAQSQRCFCWKRGKSANCEASLISCSRNWKFRSEPCCCRDLGFLNLQYLHVLPAVQIQDIQDSLLYAVRSPGVMGGGKLLRCAFASRTALGSIGSSWALWSQCQLASLSTIFNKRSELFVSILWFEQDLQSTFSLPHSGISCTLGRPAN